MTKGVFQNKGVAMTQTEFLLMFGRGLVGGEVKYFASV